MIKECQDYRSKMTTTRLDRSLTAKGLDSHSIAFVLTQWMCGNLSPVGTAPAAHFTVSHDTSFAKRGLYTVRWATWPPESQGPCEVSVTVRILK